MLYDKAKFEVRAGKGGDGIVSFRRYKFQPKGGPDGGNGGKGGDVYVKASKSKADLVDYISKNEYKAEDGSPGESNERTGASGDDLVLTVPLGVEVYQKTNQSKKLLADLSSDGDQVLVAKGGRPGKGNTAFKSSTNQTPRESTQGKLGQEKEIALELKLLTDVGLIGMPNAGKSTLLSIISRAKPKIADYPFTTTFPNLGVSDHKGTSFIVADIPGLIKDAHKGKGLGDKFLAHVERCRILVHLIDISSDNLFADYKMIRNELESYSNKLIKKEEIVVLNKIDLVSLEEVKKKQRKLEKRLSKKVLTISAISKTEIDQLQDEIIDKYQQ